MISIALNQRLSELLNNCVEEYIKSASPVSSGTMAAKDTGGLSSATIRNDLKMLEQMGLLYQVHTSGGRVPTRQGYGAYISMQDSVGFAGDIINDLYELTRLIERIDRKLGAGGTGAIRTWTHDNAMERRQNIYRLLEVPDLDMSALYLIIKERIDGRK